MFTTQTMSHVRILVQRERMYEAVLRLANFGAFAPDCEDSPPDELAQTPGEGYRRSFNQALSRLEKIVAHFAPPLDCDPGPLRVVDDDTLNALNRRLGELWSQQSAFEEAARVLAEESRQIEQLESTLENFSNLSIDLGRLAGPRTFLDIRVGLTPRINFEKMQQALGLAGYLVHPYLFANEQVHLVVTGPKDAHVTEVDRILKSAAFQDLAIPPELHDAPEIVDERLQRQRARIADDLAALAEQTRTWAQTHTPFLNEAAGVLALAEPFAMVEDAARGEGRLGMISGWVPRTRLPALGAALDGEKKIPCLLIARKPTALERPRVPSHIPRHPLFGAFLALVKQYGTPRYGEIDPTALFAIGFVCLFGMMFGDVGHGFTIAALALVFRRRLGHFTVMALAAGISSMLFGAAYGSVFGYEEIVHPLWRAPLSDPLSMLSIALAWGVGFLLLTDALYIRNRLAEDDLWGALLETRGLAGVVLYLGILGTAYGWYALGDPGTLAPASIVVALFLLMAYRWRRLQAPLAERAMIVLVEAFEAIMGNISNTLSFLRVAAFSLNHVALAIAVFTLANMLDTAGHWVMVVVGNLFILVLEGAIVTIQVLRLEYYEGFSRFYCGDGRPFQPLQLRRPVRFPQGDEKQPGGAGKPSTEPLQGSAGVPT